MRMHKMTLWCVSRGFHVDIVVFMAKKMKAFELPLGIREFLTPIKPINQDPNPILSRFTLTLPMGHEKIKADSILFSVIDRDATGRHFIRRKPTIVKNVGKLFIAERGSLITKFTPIVNQNPTKPLLKKN